MALLIIVGLSLLWLRYEQLGIPLMPEKQVRVWLVEARIDFNATGDETLVNLSLPENPPGFQLLSEQAASPGYGFSRISSPEGRRGEWSKREAEGLQNLYYKAQFAPTKERDSRQPAAAELPEPQQILWEEPEATAASDLLSAAFQSSSTEASLTRELIKTINKGEGDQNASLLLDDMSPEQLLVRLLNQADVPARLAMGLELEDARRNQSLTPLVDVFVDGQWQIFDMGPEGGNGVPEDVLVWHRSDGPVLEVMGGVNSQVRFSMIRQTVPALGLAQGQSGGRGLSRFSLYQLPIEEQGMLKLLLLLPIGALVVAFMRIIVGIQTSGTFMPVLIALAFIQTTLVPGLIAFLTIVGLGLVLRGYLSRLNLLLVARIATLIVLVVLLTALLSVFGHELGIDLGMTITFFPMIIIAWTIERMSILWEEEGAWEVLIQGGGSLVVAIIAYAAMQLPLVTHLTFNFPEVHLIILALILLTGQYTGYKVSELYRFRVMADDR
ncbi:inactive transglutaminase family protein [Halospina denitrificans]|nr:inactive transglutaminase family protein [Halospina denitrificans]